VLSGRVIGQCLPRHRHSEFLTFLKTIEREVPKRLNVHLVLDNYATHNHPKVKAWLERPPLPASLRPDILELADLPWLAKRGTDTTR
jgi:hypothetical protein